MTLTITEQLQLVSEISAAFDAIARALRQLRPIFGTDEAFSIISTGLESDRATVVRHVAQLIAGQITIPAAPESAAEAKAVQ